MAEHAGYREIGIAADVTYVEIVSADGAARWQVHRVPRAYGRFRVVGFGSAGRLYLSSAGPRRVPDYCDGGVPRDRAAAIAFALAARDAYDDGGTS